MAERRETGLRKIGPRAALTAILAAASLSVAGCDQTNAQADTGSDEIRLATAKESADFAQLPEGVRAEIRQNFADCMAEVEEFAAEETDPAMRAFELEDGEAGCDDRRASQIRSAIAHQDMDEITRDITSAG